MQFNLKRFLTVDKCMSCPHNQDEENSDGTETSAPTGKVTAGSSHQGSDRTNEDGHAAPGDSNEGESDPATKETDSEDGWQTQKKKGKKGKKGNSGKNNKTKGKDEVGARDETIPDKTIIHTSLGNTIAVDQGTDDTTSTATKSNADAGTTHSATHNQDTTTGKQTEHSNTVKKRENGEEDENSDEDESIKDPEATRTAADKKSTTKTKTATPDGTKSTQKGDQCLTKRRSFSHQETEEEALASAIQEVQLQRTTIQAEGYVKEHTDKFDTERLIKKINGALQHVTTQASRRWILSALDGVLTATPKTGNCQYNSAAEALLQRDLLAASQEYQNIIVDLTMILKYGIFLASKVLPRGEQQWQDMSALLDGTPPDTGDGEPANAAERWAQYYKDLALSKSGIRDSLASRLWGGHGTLQNLAMLLRRNVYIIVEMSSTSAYVQYYYPYKTPRGTLTAKLAQPGLEEWLIAVREEANEYKQAPVIVSLSGNHYQAVLFDKQRRGQEAKHPTSFKSPTLLDLWATTKSVDELIAEKKAMSRSKETEGPTRQELLSENLRLQPQDILPTLTQRNWSTQEKHDIISILVSEATNINELLTFTVDEDGESNSEGELMSTEEMEICSSSFALSTQTSGSGASQTSTDTYKSETGLVYRLNADSMWTVVQEEWQVQYPGRNLPDLTDTEQLNAWARTKPELLLEVGRWAADPFVVLEHLTVQAIQISVEPQRQEYLVRRLADIASTVTNEDVRRELLDWVECIKTTPDRKQRKAMLRSDDRWSQLNTYAKQYVSGPTALPFVNKEYSPACAFVLILGELFPEMPRRAFATSSTVIPPPSVHLIDVFQYVPAFRAAFEQTVENGSWDPIRQYFNFLIRMEAEGETCRH